ncbi:MAG: hypothetical protein ACYCZ1_10135 [Candidatus Humimicrobiaceae bacterium]|jgi:hypothetical protein
MPIRFNQGTIKKLLKYLNMEPFKKGSKIFGGIGKDGKWRTCKFDFHGDNKIVAIGTARIIAKSLGYKDLDDMKKFLDKNL